MAEVMSGNQHVWHANAYRLYFVSHVDNYSLVVLMPDPGDRLVHFLVLRQDDDDGAEALIGSGTTEDLLAAMKAAVQMAARLTGKECPLLSSPDRQQPVRVEWSRAEKLLWRAVRTSVQRY